MAVLLDGQTQARTHMGVNVVCPRDNAHRGESNNSRKGSNNVLK